jgi:hypothetical protein
MSKNATPLKSTQVFGWEAEPTDERPSEFIPSTGFSSLSGYYAMPPSKNFRPRTSVKSALSTWLLVAVVLGTAIFALVMMVRMLKG